MKKIIALVLLVLLLAACANDNGGSDAVPVIDDTGTTNTEDTVAAQEAPRTEATPDPGLPPTYTPAPMIHGGHLYAVGGYSGASLLYVVEPGDTLAKLCARYGVPVEDLARINGIRNPNHMEVGDTLTIPIPVGDGS
jgi:nucleoid-associated protein YgaU